MKNCSKGETRLTYNCAHLRSTKESLTIEYLRIIFFCGGEKECERRIFGERKDIFVEEKKNGKGKGGKYLERENVTMARQSTNKERSGFFGLKIFGWNFVG